MLSKEARELLECLPDDGTAISGGNLKWDTEFDTRTFKAAKAELKEAGLVTVGRGRGGTVARIPDAPVKEALPMPPKEKMAKAREAKVAKGEERKQESKASQEIQERRDIVTKWAAKHYGVPNEDVTVTFTGHQLEQPIIAVRDDKIERVGPVPIDVCIDLGV